MSMFYSNSLIASSFLCKQLLYNLRKFVQIYSLSHFCLHVFAAFARMQFIMSSIL